MKKLIPLLILAACVRPHAVVDRSFRPATATELRWAGKLKVLDSWAGEIEYANGTVSNVVCIKGYGEHIAPRWYLWREGRYVDFKNVSVTCNPNI